MITIRYYKESDWEQFKDFININWRQNHPITNKKFFDWHFRGFGNQNGKINSIVLYNNDDLIGFRGVIPGLFQVPINGVEMKVLQGGTFSMWMICSEFRGRKLGLSMLRETEKMTDVLLTLGSDRKTSAPIYQKSMWNGLDSMPRYITILKLPEYQELLKDDVNEVFLNDHVEERNMGNDILNPCMPDLAEIERVWKEITFRLNIFSLYRNMEFWQYRYLNHPVFHYYFFGSMAEAGIIVARVEDIYSDENTEKRDFKILRIIEMLPKKIDTWKGMLDKEFIKLLFGVCGWAKSRGCITADFYCSSGRLESLILEAGFVKQPIHFNSTKRLLPHNFQPISFEISPINIHARIFHNGKAEEVDFANSYIVKSDGDIDRPNSI